jgi:hypothetical protein
VISARSAKGGVPPLALFAEYLHDFVGDEPIRSAGELAMRLAQSQDANRREGGIAGPLEFLLEIDAGDAEWSAWEAFIVAWADASRVFGAESRAALLIVLAGCKQRALPIAAPALCVHAYRNVVDETDMLIYAAEAFTESRLTALHRRVAIAVSARLAVWDPDVVDVLADETLSSILEPKELLTSLARERHWTDTGLRESREWGDGHEDAIGPTSFVSAAALALLGDTSAIRQRVWSGQVGVMMPFLEERRQEVLHHLDGQLREWQTHFKDIIDPRDLELSHLLKQVRLYR